MTELDQEEQNNMDIQTEYSEGFQNNFYSFRNLDTTSTWNLKGVEVILQTSIEGDFEFSDEFLDKYGMTWEDENLSCIKGEQEFFRSDPKLVKAVKDFGYSLDESIIGYDFKAAADGCQIRIVKWNSFLPFHIDSTLGVENLYLDYSSIFRRINSSMGEIEENISDTKVVEIMKELCNEEKSLREKSIGFAYFGVG